MNDTPDRTSRYQADSLSLIGAGIFALTGKLAEMTAPRAERDGKTFYFCSDHCRQKFLSTPAGSKPEDKSGSCCG